MAITAEYEVYLESDNRRLPEYEYHNEDQTPTSQKHVKCYVEAKSGMKFSIVIIRRDYSEHDTTARGIVIDIDGKRLSGVLIRHSSPHLCVSRHEMVTSYKNGSWVNLPLAFGDLHTTENDVGRVDLSSKAENIGRIKVGVVACVPRGQSETRAPTGEEFQLGSQCIPEKALKGRPIDLSVTYGEARPCNPNFHDVNMIGGPIATFEFHYRSRRALQLQDLIPEDAETAVLDEPTSLEDRNPEELNLEEARQLLRQYRNEKNGLATQRELIKREERKSDSTGKLCGKRAKGEQDDESDDDCHIISVKRCKNQQEVKKEVIDLSDI